MSGQQLPALWLDILGLVRAHSGTEDAHSLVYERFRGIPNSELTEAIIGLCDGGFLLALDGEAWAITPDGLRLSESLEHRRAVLNMHVGSSLDGLLESDGTLAEVAAIARKRVEEHSVAVAGTDHQAKAPLAAALELTRDGVICAVCRGPFRTGDIARWKKAGLVCARCLTAPEPKSAGPSKVADDPAAKWTGIQPAPRLPRRGWLDPIGGAFPLGAGRQILFELPHDFRAADAFKIYCHLITLSGDFQPNREQFEQTFLAAFSGSDHAGSADAPSHPTPPPGAAPVAGPG